MSDLKAGLQRSFDNRKKMLAQFGFIPMSILRLHRGTLSRKLFNYAGDANTSAYMANNNKEKLLRLAEVGYNKASPSDRGAGRGKPGLSIMPAELVEFFIKYYSKPGDTYLDPFMGQGVQLQVAKALGLDYWGYDISKEFFKYIKEIKEKVDDGATKIKIFCADSRTPTKIPDGIGDFSFHSPPYWDIEYYGDEPEQLGKNTYQEFLHDMEEVARAWLPKFKQGAFHVVNVNDFRKDGRFVPYHADTILLFERAGWQFYDMWIIEGLVGGMPKAFAVDFNLKRISPKIHEYALVFKKP